MTTWPLKEKKVTVSTTIKPVTQVALVDVNRASRNPMLPGATVISGSMSRTVPMVISPRKLMMKMTAGFSLIRGNTRPPRSNSARTMVKK